MVIARTQTKTCPVQMTERYLELANIVGSPNLHLFRGIVHSKNGVRLHAQGGLSYTRMHELQLEKLAQVGLDPKKTMVSTVFGLVVPLQLRMLGYRTGSSSSMAAGRVRTPKMAT